MKNLPPSILSLVGETINVIGGNDTLTTTTWPTRIAVEGLDVVRETLLKGWLLAAALVLLGRGAETAAADFATAPG